MKLPAQLGALIVTAIGGLVLVAGEVRMSHPLHQVLVIAGAFAAGVVGLLTIPPLNPGVSVSSGPPFNIPDPLPMPAPAPAATPVPAQPVDPAARSLP